MIEIENLCKNFNDQEIFNNMNLSLSKNKISVLVGKSGEGKSTLFRMIMGLEEIDSGYINIDETSKVGMVFQNYELYPHLSVLNNLVLPQKVINKVSKENAKQKAVEVLKTLGIEYLIKKTVTTLSGGESQRLAIARTLVMGNNVLLLDEPTSALDQENIENLISLLKKLSEETTLFIITHDLGFASKVGDVMYKIEDKKIVKYSLN
jgi:ABC-type polar amino acid transport system ATPase subunit